MEDRHHAAALTKNVQTSNIVICRADHSQIIFWAFIQTAIKPEICFAMIYPSIVFHIVHAFNFYKFSALQLHQYK